ncbi:rod shape-determining protein MreC [Neisseria zalophi]|uniref:Cell shape-determining protein MreC n=1 Tax=Neisseria zalophi TaxID=640030 RepID=A0A5J6Q0Q8_9NEIS|nr:rod shape-determining protein MreC [Neisseria zalophi]QEY26520.1 rod shape-determining protein MreC [Neisseria zalophi]
MSEQPLNFSRKGMKSSSKLIILSIVSVALMMLDSRYSAVQKVKSYTATALYPLQWIANQPVYFYRYISDSVQSQTDLVAESKRLSEENGRLKLLLAQAGVQQKELIELKKLQGLQQSGIRISGMATIISNGRDPLADRLILNKGEVSGFKVGDAAVDQNGLIGQITQVHPLSAELTLITNSKMVIPIMVERTGVRSLLYGSGSSINLRYFPADADLRPDDVLVTSGLDSIYPEGIPVAKVLQVFRVAGTPYYRVTLTPLSGFRNSKYVLVLPQKKLPEQLSPASDSAKAKRP